MRIPKKKHLFIISALAIILGLSAYKALRTEAPLLYDRKPRCEKRVKGGICYGYH